MNAGVQPIGDVALYDSPPENANEPTLLDEQIVDVERRSIFVL